jgi:hypothetical protein
MCQILSPYAKQLLEELEPKETSTEKLIPNLHSKEKYVVHYRNLKLYLSLGMKLTKSFIWRKLFLREFTFRFKILVGILVFSEAGLFSLFQNNLS